MLWSFVRSTTAMQHGCELTSLHITRTWSYPLNRYNPISIESFDSEVSSQFYGPNAGPLPDEPVIYHRLSLMFMVMAIGSLMDHSLPAYSLEAEKYHHLAKAALFHNSIFDEPTINAVQALVRFVLRFFDPDLIVGRYSTL